MPVTALTIRLGMFGLCVPYRRTRQMTHYASAIALVHALQLLVLCQERAPYPTLLVD